MMSVFLSYKLINAFKKRLKVTSFFYNYVKPKARELSNKIGAQNVNETFVPFLEVLRHRRAQARRSILVQVQSSLSHKELHSYCNTLGPVKEMLHYSVGNDSMHFIIVEFGSEQDVANILSQSSHVDDLQVVPVQSQFLWFKASNRKLSKLKESNDAVLSIQDGNEIMKPAEILVGLTQCDSLSSQMTFLYDKTKLNDLGIRLRFLTACQLENALNGMFPTVSAFPFGSSVNGFGKMGCDLDLVLRLSNEKIKDDSRLMFYTKAVSGSERTIAQRNMETLGDLLELFLPGCSQVRRILQARIPIIKYYQRLTDIECDLSMSNMSGVHMSDFLYIMGSLDNRVRPLIFTIRKWASEMGLTNPSPGRWITNFSLTLLVIAFLQRPLHSPPILPSLNTLVRSADSQDQYITEDGINCTFLRNIKQLKLSQSNNQQSLGDLLIEFFEFYSQFDFATRAICLNEAVSIRKPEHCAMYIVNPLERGLNVSKNVSIEELDRFKVEARNAAWLLESREDVATKWGLVPLFERKSKPGDFIHFKHFNKSRLMNIKTIFQEQQKESVEFKSEIVKKQIQTIKNDGKAKLKALEKLHR